jgi:hypothetical protein
MREMCAKRGRAIARPSAYSAVAPARTVGRVDAGGDEHHEENRPTQALKRG